MAGDDGISGQVRYSITLTPDEFGYYSHGANCRKPTGRSPVAGGASAGTEVQYSVDRRSPTKKGSAVAPDCLPGPSNKVAQISEAQDLAIVRRLSGPLNHSLLVVSPRVPRAGVDFSLGRHGWGSCLMRYDRAPCACFYHRSAAFHLLGRYVEPVPSHLYAWAY